MRNNPHLHEKHLLEAVRQKILTAEQMEAVMALSRTMTASGDGSPDLGWIANVHGATAALAVAIPTIYLLAQMDRWDAVSLLLASVVCAVGSFALSRLARALGMGPVPQSVFLAGVGMFSFGIAASGVDMVFAHSFGHHMYEVIGDGDSLRMARHGSIVAGFVGMALSSLVLWRTTRAAPTGVPLGIAALVGPYALLELVRLTLHMGGDLPDREGTLVVLLLGAMIVAGAKVYERFNRTNADLSFWAMAVPLLPMGVAAMARIDRTAGEAVVWLVVGLIVGGLGLLWNRRALLAAGAMAVVCFPSFGLSEAHADENIVIGALIASVLAVVVAATGLRRFYLQRWMDARDARDDEKTAWM